MAGLQPDAVAVDILSHNTTLHGDLHLPAGARGLVLFAHGSGSSRRSPRNLFVAGVLARSGIATLLFDLLTTREEAVDVHTREFRFNIALLTRRLSGATGWVLQQDRFGGMPLGYFGASTGAAAALAASCDRPEVVAIVSRGGRPDLAGESLPRVRAATLLIVGGDDDVVIDLNREALAQLRCEARLAIVPGATHLFEEPGTLEQVADHAARWFAERFAATAKQQRSNA